MQTYLNKKINFIPISSYPDAKSHFNNDIKETELMQFNLISNATNITGLKVRVELDKTSYPTGIKVSDKDFDRINIKTRGISWRVELYMISPESA